MIEVEQATATISMRRKIAERRREQLRRATERTLPIAPLAMLAACGGAGGGTDPLPPPPEPFTGRADAMAVPVGSATVTGNVLANDGTAGGPSLAVMAIGVQNGATGTVGQPLQGALGQLTVQADGSFTYAVGAGTGAFAALAEGQTATETFVYTPAANGAGGNPQTLTLTLTGANDAPIAAADAGSALSADVKTPMTGNVLANDADPDAGAALAVTAVRAGSGQLAQGLQNAKAAGLPAVVGKYGTLTMSSDGTYSYVLDVTDPDTLALAAGQTGVETFTYTLSDGKLSTTAILTFSVAGVDEAPSAAPGPFGETDSNDTITGTAGVDTIAARGGDDLIEALFGADVVDGGAGIDTISYASSNAGVVVDLADSSVNFGGDAEGDVLTNIENIIGSAQSDTLYGDAGVNRLAGGDGGDNLYGLGGADHLDGGAGTNDWAVYMASDAGVTVDLAAGTGVGGHAEGDTLVSVDGVLGSIHDDALRGDDTNNFLSGREGNDVLVGRAGDDTLRGGAGADAIDGGDGTDTLSFVGSTASVTIDLVAGTGAGGDAQGDTYTGVESVIGTSYNDSFIASAAANRFSGMGGADTVSYAASTAAVAVNLATYSATGGYAAGDTYSGIRVIVGSAYDDSLTGDNTANTLSGGAGRDLLIGLTGADTLDGGDGIDTVSYAGSFMPVTVSLLTGVGIGNDAQGDVISNVENLIGSGGNDTLEGNDGANLLDGGQSTGFDTLRGMGGDDVLEGGAGADTLTGGLGADTFSFDLLTSDADRDIITDFQSGTDKLFFAEDEFDVGALFEAGAAPYATTAQAAFLYDTGTGELRYDADGDGAGAAVLMAILDGAPSLQASDILVA